MTNTTPTTLPLSDRITTRNSYPTEHSCKICGTTAPLLWLREERQQFNIYDFFGEDYVRPYFQCPDCDFIFCIDFDVLTGDELDQIYGAPSRKRAKRYANNTIDPDQEKFKLEVNRGVRELHMVSVLSQMFKIDLQTAKILVFGCGIGLSFNLLMQNKLRVWATDYAAFDFRGTGYAANVFAHNLTPLMNKRFYQLDDAPKNEFELITMTEVFEHFTDPVAELGGVVSRLKVGGRIVGTTGMVDWRNEDFSEWWYNVPQSHISFLSQKSFQIIMAKLGCIGMVFPSTPQVVGEGRLSDSQCVFVVQRVR